MADKGSGKGKRRKGSAVQSWRHAMPWIAVALVAVGFLTTWGIGTLSGLGWGDLTMLCPLGALTTMLASKLFVPRAVISLAIAVILVLLVGRGFCGWVCPVPAVGRLRGLFSKKTKREGRPAKAADDGRERGAVVGDEAGGWQDAPGTSALTKAEKRAIKREMRQAGCRAHAHELRGQLDSRHLVLGGALVSALVFGFPVFCLVCPIGLTFATVLLVMRAFGAGDISIALVLVPLLLVAEVVFFRRWCRSICPLGALMGLVARGNKTLRPTIDDARCLETSRGRTCGACGRACGEGIDIRHLQTSSVLPSECVRCHKCVEACPTHAVSMPLLARRCESGRSAGDAAA